MSSSYQGRHRGKHRKPATSRVPRALHPGFVLPSAVAAALVVTATGASVAESAPLTLDLTAAQAQTAREQAATEVAAQADLSSRRQQVAMQTAAVQGRVAEQQRVARDKARAAAAAKAAAEAKAKAEAAEKAAKAAAEEKAKREGKRWVSAVEGARFTSGYGMRWGRMHWGNDFGTPIGTPLRAMSKGTVTWASPDGARGNLVRIMYWDGTESYYAHMNSFSTYVGEKVMPGDIVGRSGNTGRSTGPHVHLEIRPGGGEAINPGPWLRERGIW